MSNQKPKVPNEEQRQSKTSEGKRTSNNEFNRTNSIRAVEVDSSQPSQPPNTKTAPPSKQTKIGKIFGTLVHPDCSDVCQVKLEGLRDKIKEAQDAEKTRKKVKQRKRQMKLLRLQNKSKHFMDGLKSHPHLIQINDFDGVIAKDDKNVRKPRMSGSSGGNLSQVGGRNSGEMNSNNYRYAAHGPTHVAAFSNDKESEWEAKRKKISQLYEGIGVYSHSLSNFYDSPANSRFYALLDEETRNNYPLTHAVKIKIERIRKAYEKKKARRSSACMSWLKRQFFQTSFGNVFRVTPRYYKMTPPVPKLCRRCKYPLKETLEARWTSTGITFAVLFPIIGILCCLANREFVCVVCEEIYVYGDFPSRCKPGGTGQEDFLYSLSARRQSYKNWISNEDIDDDRRRSTLA